MKPFAWLTAVAIVCLAPCSLYGQQALGDGRALDNNLRVGGGGKNTPQPRVDYRLRNAVITGNVSGLGHFHGNVPYRAPGEFNGDLASNSLFRFHARGLGGSGGTVPAHRSMDAVSVADVQQIPLGQNLRRPRDAASIGGMRSWRPGGESIGMSGQPGVSLGIVHKADGRVLELSASPLLGVRSVDLRPRAASRPLLRDDVGPRSPGAAESLAYRVSDKAVAEALTGSANRIDTGSELRIFPWSVEPLKYDGVVRTLEEQIEDIHSRLPIPHPVIHGEPGQDVYRDLLFEIQESRGDSLGAQETPQQTVVPQDTLSGLVPDPLDPDQADELEPEPDELDDDLRSRRAARGLAGGSAEDRLKRLAESIDYDIAVVTSLAASNDEQMQQMLLRAEVQLASAEYFNAESTYRGLIELMPGNPMVRVGLVHAQLGAGMMLSAGQNLVDLLTDHPELIAIRYEARLLSPPARLKQVRSELTAMLQRDKTGKAALLLAYVGYQLSDKASLTAGLDEAATRLPDDILPQLLRRVWLEGPEPKPDQATQPATEGEPTK